MKKTLKIFALGALVATAATVHAEEVASWKQVSASDNTTYAIKADGTLWAWGDNELGELGTGSTDLKFSSTPLQLGSDATWKEVSGARGAGFFIKEDGTLWAVGSNEYGMSGVGDGQTKHTSLVQVGTDSNWAHVYASVTWSYTVFAIKTDGTLWSWGSGSTFMLGHGNTNNSPVPAQVGTDTDWKELSVGTSHVLALKDNGELWGWGFAPYGQLMNADVTNVKVPTQIGTDTWKSVYAIDNASYGVKADGTFWAWGDNTLNLLGLNSSMGEDDVNEDGSLENIAEPQQVTAIPAEVTEMSGCQYVRVVKAGDKVYAWGANGNGALGNGKGTDYQADGNQYSYVPVEVALPEDVVVTELTSGQRFSAVLSADGKIYGWGSNRWGQMGNYVDDSKLTFCPSPIEMAVPAPADPGDYTISADNIPSSLTDAVKLTLTGEWGTSEFQKLCNAIGANMGFPPVGNSTLVTVDMSAATIKPNTSMYVPAGMQNAGVFKMCKALESVKFPANETAANIVDLHECFMNCLSLTSCDVSSLTGVTNITDAFYATPITNVNLSAWENVTKSEDAFGKCYSLASVILPANFTVGKYLFNSCTALRLVDWSLYAGETAPVISADAKVFQDLTAEQQAEITVMVPEAVFEAFKADVTWQYVNLQAVKEQREGVYYIDGFNIPANLTDAVEIYMTGLWNSNSLKALATAIGNTGTAGNNVLELVDMSEAQIEVGTNMNAEFPGALFGTVTKGTFENCKVLNTVVMPVANQAANVRSFKKAFYNCESLTELDLSGFTGLTTTEDAMYGCSALVKVTLPGNFAFASGTLDRCNALETIDWSLYEGTEAPAFKTGSIPSRGKNLTIMVPEGAYDSFVANASWNGYNIVAVKGTVNVTVNRAEAGNATVYDLTGRKVAEVSAGNINTLPAGLYIVNGRKVVVK